MKKALILVMSASWLLACSPERPKGWGADTHARDAEPNYSEVFSDDRVNRIDVLLDPENWQAMLDDMTEIYGEFGESGNQQQEIPPELFEACDGLGQGDECTVVLEGEELSAECQWIWEDLLGCAVQPPQNGFIADLIEACLGLSHGDDCTAPVGVPVPGTCLQDLELICMPNQAISACTGKAAGDPCDLPDRKGECQDAQGTVFCKPQDQGRPDIKPQGDEDPVWVPCTVQYNGIEWWQVGIRFKGNSSLWHTWQSGSYKLPFKFDMDEFEDDYPKITNQRFYGFKRLAFANNARDSSYLHEKVAGDLFAEGGVPTPDRAFYRVYFDIGDGPVYFGLYTLVEVPDDPMFNREFEDDSGNLYKPDGPPATWQPDLVVTNQNFYKKTNQEDHDCSDAQAAIDALHASYSDAAEWRAALEEHFDVDGFLRWLAINTVIENWDSYGNIWHNYYIYGDPQSGRIVWIPWDLNESFSEHTGIKAALPLDMASVTQEWPLIRNLYDDPVYSEIYWQHVQDFTEGPFNQTDVRQRLQDEHDLIAPYVTGPEGEQEPYTLLQDPQMFDTSLEQLFDHVDSRHTAVQQALEQ